jgi:glutamate/tyrosine decarboxylase-like PLP-dependent enzyme
VGKLSGKDVPAMILNGGGQAESDRHMVPYRMAVAAIARELDLQLIRYGEALDGHPSAEMVSVDGTHPSKAAHGVIAEVMIGALSRVGAAAELSA